MWTIMTLDQWKNWSMRAKRSLPWEKGGTGVSFPLAKANSVVLRGGIGLTWRQPQLKRLYRSSRANDCPGM